MKDFFGTKEKHTNRTQVKITEEKNQTKYIKYPKKNTNKEIEEEIELEEKIEETINTKQTNTIKTEELLQSNKKNIIKEKILQHIKETETNTLEMKKMFVDEKKYCSKATFYRYISEIKRNKNLQSMTINGKEILSIIKF